MTILDVISTVDKEKPNEYTTEQKLQWINEVESAVCAELTDSGFVPYDVNDEQTALLGIPDPYSKMYIEYVKAQIDYANEDYDSYNSGIARYNNFYQRYADYITRHTGPAHNCINYM